MERVPCINVTVKADGTREYTEVWPKTKTLAQIAQEERALLLDAVDRATERGFTIETVVKAIDGIKVR